MDKKINDRKNIINAFKSNLGAPKKGIEKRIQFLKGMTILNLILTLISAGILVLSILAGIVDYEIIKCQKWPLLAILSLSSIMSFPNQFYELKLLKHLKWLNSKSELNGIDSLNSELKTIINKLNNRFKNNWDVILLAIVILVMGIWQMGFGDNNSYCEYIKFPTLTFYGLILFRFLVTNRKLNKNINETMKYFS